MVQKNRVYDEVTETEIEEIRNGETPNDQVAIRLNGKYVWETAKRVCEYINAHEDLIHITTFGEYKEVMKKVMMVIREARNVERKRRQTSRKKKEAETKAMTQRAKSLIASIKGGRMTKDDIEKISKQSSERGEAKRSRKRPRRRRSLKELRRCPRGKSKLKNGNV